MNDLQQLKQAKEKCLSDLAEWLPHYAPKLNEIDSRLITYIEDAISNHASHANLFELLGIRKTLRLTA